MWKYVKIQMKIQKQLMYGVNIYYKLRIDIAIFGDADERISDK